MPAGVAKLNGKTEIPWELSEKLAQLLNSDAKRLQIGQRGREAVIAYNDFSGTLEKLETMYCSLGEG